MTEWPLMVFTLALQLAAGIALVLTIADLFLSGPSVSALRPAGLAVFPIAALGLAVSILHLGRPQVAFLSLANLGDSPLSHEVLACLLFVPAAFFYSLMWRRGKRRGRPAVGVLVSILGLGAVAASSLVYLVPSLPAWNAGWLPLSFLASAATFGGLVPLALWRERPDPRTLRFQALMVLAGSGGLFVSAVWLVSFLSHGPADDFASGIMSRASQLLLGRYATLFGLHLLLAVVIPAVFAVRLWPSGRGHELFWSRTISQAVGAAGVAGVAIGRALTYALLRTQLG